MPLLNFISGCLKKAFEEIATKRFHFTDSCFSEKGSVPKDGFLKIDSNTFLSAAIRLCLEQPYAMRHLPIQLNSKL